MNVSPFEGMIWLNWPCAEGVGAGREVVRRVGRKRAGEHADVVARGYFHRPCWRASQAR